MEIFKGIFMLSGLGNDCNIYVVDREIVVDTGTGSFFHQIKNDIELNLDTSKLKRIVNTHCHFDHTGSDKKFRDWLKADIMIHSDDKRALETGNGTLAEMFGEKPKITTVERTLKNGNTLKTQNFNFEVISTPGHTPGSICLYEKERHILISGDTLFSNAIGRTDLPGGSPDDMLESLKKLTEYHIRYLLPGHGSPVGSGVNFMIKQLVHSQKIIPRI